MLTLAHVFDQLQWASQWANPAITLPNHTPVSAVVCDTRHVVPGCLFVALTGSKTDAHTLVAQAFEAGALTAVIQGDRSNLLPTDVLATRPLIMTSPWPPWP
jgi:UDP-N-acetylmuramyl pentapeptide synthase